MSEGNEMLFGAMNFPIRPLLEEIDAISSLGFDYLELTMDPPEAHHETIRENKEALLNALGVRHMSLVCHLPTFVNTADLTAGLRAASLKEILQSLEMAAEIQPSKVVLHPGYFTGLSSLVLEQVQGYALRSLEKIVHTADRLGLCLCIENMFPKIGGYTKPEDFVALFKAFPSLKMTLDIGHANLGSKASKKALGFIEQFADRIDHLHASDNFGNRDDHLPIGTGTVEFLKIIEALKRIGYDATVTFEVFSRDRDYLRISREKFIVMWDAA
jgi:sugar phosphate isomerase/epimerase